MNELENHREMRLDKWLWAARFFKTRALAAQAVSGGKVAVNGSRSKPSRLLRTGDRLAIRRGPYEWNVVVRDLARLRGPASQAQALYEETPESIQSRATAAARLKWEQPPAFDTPGRPSKKDRRAMNRLRGR